MPYQYYCPCEKQQLLEGTEELAGQQVQCPMCPQVFVQPYPAGAQQQPAGSNPNMQAPYGGGGYQAPGGSSMGFPGPGGSNPAYPPQGGSSAGLDPLMGSGPHADHELELICPNCKGKLIVMESQLGPGSEAGCPHCNEVIELLEEYTTEYMRQREAYLRQKEEQLARKWMNIAIGASILVGIGMLVMIVLLNLD